MEGVDGYVVSHNIGQYGIYGIHSKQCSIWNLWDLVELLAGEESNFTLWQAYRGWHFKL